MKTRDISLDLGLACVAIMSLVFVTLLAALRPLGAQVASGESCHVQQESPRRVELADGRTVSVDVQSVAASGGVVMAVGRHAYVFPRSTTPRTSPDPDTIIGFVTDGRGSATLVPAPLRSRRVFFPRVAPAGDGAFHVLFITANDSANSQLTPLDTATIWYLRFAKGAWSAPEQVTTTRQALLRSETSSELMAHDGSLAFVFPFAGRKADSKGGIVLARRRRNVWTADTLRTPDVPNHVRAILAPGQRSILAAIAQSVPRDGRSPADELYFARFDSVWSEPHKVGGNGTLGVDLTVLAQVGDEVVASWVSLRMLDTKTSRLEWLRLGPDDDRVQHKPMIGRGSEMYPFEMVVVDNRYPLWLYHDGPAGDAVTLRLASDSTVLRLTSVATPFENPKAKAVALPDARVLVFTMKVGKADNEPMAASWTTALAIRCPGSAQR